MPCAPFPPPPPAIWPAAEGPSPLTRLEALEAEELRLLAVGPCGRPLPEVADRLQRLRARAETELVPSDRACPHLGHARARARMTSSVEILPAREADELREATLKRSA